MSHAKQIVAGPAMLCLILSLLMTPLSAWIRLAESGTGCSPWPACRTTSFTIDKDPGLTIAQTDANQGLRVAHRLMASAYGVVSLILLLLGLFYRKDLPLSPVFPVLIFLLMLVLAAVGLKTPDLFHPVITTANISIGMLSSTMLWFYVLVLTAPSQPRYRPGHLQELTNIFLVLFVVSSGAWASANLAGGYCETLLTCRNLDAGRFSEAFNPAREILISDGTLQLGMEQPVIAFTHHVLAILLCFSLGYRIWRNRATTPRTAAATALIVSLVVLSGVADTFGTGMLTAWLHNFWSAMLLLTVVYQYFLLTLAAPEDDLPDSSQTPAENRHD